MFENILNYLEVEFQPHARVSGSILVNDKNMKFTNYFRFFQIQNLL